MKRARDLLLSQDKGPENDLRVRVRDLEDEKFIRYSVNAVRQEALDFRAIDDAGRVRMIMSAVSLLEEFGINAYIAGFDTSGNPMFYFDADTGAGMAGGGLVRLDKDGLSLRRYEGGVGSGTGSSIKWYDTAGNVVFEIYSGNQSGTSQYNDIAVTRISGSDECRSLWQISNSEPGTATGSPSVRLIATSTNGLVRFVADAIGINESTPIEMLDIGGTLGASAVYLDEAAAPGTPAAGKGVLYFKTDSLPYCKNHDGTEMALYNAASSPAAVLGCGAIGQIAAGVTRYIHPMGGDVQVGTENQVSFPAPYAGTIRNLHIFISSAQPAGGSLTVTIRKGTDGAMADTAVTKVIASSAAAGVYSDTANSDTVTQGQLISVKIINGAPATLSAQIRGVSFEIAKS